MEQLKCTKCGQEAYTNDELITGICKCGGKLEEENEFGMYEADGIDTDF